MYALAKNKGIKRGWKVVWNILFGSLFCIHALLWISIGLVSRDDYGVSVTEKVNYKEIGDLKDLSYAGVKRLSATITIPAGTSEEAARNALLRAAERIGRREKADAMTVNGFIEGEDISASYLTYSFGISTWAPNGEWGDAGLSAPKKAVIDIMAKPADDGRYYPASPDEAEEKEPASEETTSVAEEPAVAAEDKTPVVAKEAPAPDFGITIEEFIANYETALKEINQYEGKVFTPKEDISDDGRIIVQVDPDDFTVLIIRAKGNRLVREVSYIGGVGTITPSTAEALDILFGALATAMALENPRMPSPKRSDLGRELWLFEKKLPVGRTIGVRRNNIAYNVSMMDNSGVIIGARAIK